MEFDFHFVLTCFPLVFPSVCSVMASSRRFNTFSTIKTRGWFYTLTVLAAALFDKPAYKNLIVNGLVLASDGRKMSKRLKNYPGEFH